MFNFFSHFKHLKNLFNTQKKNIVIKKLKYYIEQNG